MTHHKYTTARERRGPFEELERLFDVLDDGDLLAALEGTRWTGRPGYPIRVMWRTLVASFYLGIVHDTDLVRALDSNPLLAAACGIDGPDAVPSKFAYCRFRRKLVGFSDAVADVLSRATDVKAWANGFHHETDPDAGTGAKKKAPHKFYWYGYKVHLAVDARSELPVWFTVTPANSNDGRNLPPLLTETKLRHGWFKPQEVLADKGYDSRDCFRFVGEKLGATPIIDIQMRQARKAQEGRECEAVAVPSPDGLRFRCERLPYEKLCPRFGHCPALPMFADSPLNDVDAPYYEQCSPFPYGSREWELLYNKRVSVERAFSRLKGYRKLNAIRTRRLPKVWLHVALSLLAMLAAAVGADTSAVRRCIV